MKFKKMIFLSFLILVFLTPSFIFFQPPEKEDIQMEEDSSSGKMDIDVSSEEQKAETFKLLVTKKDPDENIEDNPVIASVDIPYEAALFSKLLKIKMRASYSKGQTNNYNFFGLIPGIKDFNEETGYQEKDIPQIKKMLQTIGDNLTLIYKKYMEIIKDKYNKNIDGFREKLKSEIESFIKNKHNLKELKENDEIDLDLSQFDEEEKNQIFRNYIKNNIKEDRIRKNKNDFNNVAIALREKIRKETSDDIEALMKQLKMADFLKCKEYIAAILPTTYTLYDIDWAKIQTLILEKEIEKQLEWQAIETKKKRSLDDEAKKDLESKQEKLSMVINSINDAIKSLYNYFNSPQVILNEVLTLEGENQINLPMVINSINDAIKPLYNYFNSPQVILNEVLKNQINLPADLPEEEQPAWQGSQIQINWREEWENLDTKWKKLKKQKPISIADLNNHLFARLLIVAKAYLNKNNNQVTIGNIEGNELFKAALNLLSSQDDKYLNIRDRLNLNRKIDLSAQQITSNDLPFISFFLSRNTNLQELLLDYNKIKEIQPGAFDGLKSLEDLMLSDNQIKEIPEGAFTGLENLKELNLYRNQIKEIQPGAFTGLKNLEKLRLFNNKIKEIRRWVFTVLANLKKLNLSDNQIEEIKRGAFTGLKSLITLKLENNQIEEIQRKAFTSLESLEHLYLFDNKIKEIPEGVFTGLKSLKELGLYNNSLNKIPDRAFGGLKELIWLYLFKNKIKEIQQGAFTGLEELLKLSLNDNQIKEIKPGVFTGLAKLKQLHLYKNRLKEIPDGAFTGFEELRWLSLNSNQIEEIKPGAFTGLANLEELRLDDNQIEQPLSPRLNETLPNIKKILIKNAGKNNEPIKIPIAREARDDFANKLYKDRVTIASEGTDYIFVALTFIGKIGELLELANM